MKDIASLKINFGRKMGVRKMKRIKISFSFDWQSLAFLVGFRVDTWTSLLWEGHGKWEGDCWRFKIWITDWSHRKDFIRYFVFVCPTNLLILWKLRFYNLYRCPLIPYVGQVLRKLRWLDQIHDAILMCQVIPHLIIKIKAQQRIGIAAIRSRVLKHV